MLNGVNFFLNSMNQKTGVYFSFPGHGHFDFSIPLLKEVSHLSNVTVFSSSYSCNTYVKILLENGINNIVHYPDLIHRCNSNGRNSRFFPELRENIKFIINQHFDYCKFDFIIAEHAMNWAIFGAAPFLIAKSCNIPFFSKKADYLNHDNYTCKNLKQTLNLLKEMNEDAAVALRSSLIHNENIICVSDYTQISFNPTAFLELMPNMRIAEYFIDLFQTDKVSYHGYNKMLFSSILSNSSYTKSNRISITNRFGLGVEKRNKQVSSSFNNVYISFGSDVPLIYDAKVLSEFVLKYTNYSVIITTANNIEYYTALNNYFYDNERVKLNLWLEPKESFKDAKYFISSCGAGATYDALYYGVPIICYPLTVEMALNGETVSELGCGINMVHRYSSLYGTLEDKILDYESLKEDFFMAFQHYFDDIENSYDNFSDSLHEFKQSYIIENNSETLITAYSILNTSDPIILGNSNPIISDDL